MSHATTKLNSPLRAAHPGAVPCNNGSRRFVLLSTMLAAFV